MVEQMVKLADFIDNLKLDNLQDVIGKKDQNAYVDFIENEKPNATTRVKTMTEKANGLKVCFKIMSRYILLIFQIFLQKISFLATAASKNLK